MKIKYQIWDTEIKIRSYSRELQVLDWVCFLIRWRMVGKAKLWRCRHLWELLWCNVWGGEGFDGPPASQPAAEWGHTTLLSFLVVGAKPSLCFFIFFIFCDQGAKPSLAFLFKTLAAVNAPLVGLFPSRSLVKRIVVFYSF